MKRLALIFSAALLSGCASQTAINLSYDLGKIKRIGTVQFDAPSSDIRGIEDIFSKHLIANGFNVMERARLAQIMDEHKITAQGLISPETSKSVGKILGVDALLMGTVVSYTPPREEVSYIETYSNYEEPVYQQTSERQQDGSFKTVYVQNGTKVTREATKTPHVYTSYAQVGVTVKLVDIETGDIIWVGSDTNEGIDAASAAEASASYLAARLRKNWDGSLKARQTAKEKNGG